MVQKKPVLTSVADQSFEQQYPNLAKWVQGGGWLEIGNVDGFSSFVMILDEGGMIWEGKPSYPTIDEAFRDAERAIKRWVRQNLGEGEVIN